MELNSKRKIQASIATGLIIFCLGLLIAYISKEGFNTALFLATTILASLSFFDIALILLESRIGREKYLKVCKFAGYAIGIGLVASGFAFSIWLSMAGVAVLMTTQLLYWKETRKLAKAKLV
jgi:phosphoglycerol transferase MdoB-like AlkP superfamily enzyme